MLLPQNRPGPSPRQALRNKTFAGDIGRPLAGASRLDACSVDSVTVRDLAAGRNYSSGAHREHRYDEAMRTFLLATATAAVALAATPAAAADLDRKSVVSG